MHATPGLHIENDVNTAAPSTTTMNLVSALRTIYRAGGGMEQARDIITSFPITITFDEVIEYQQAEDEKISEQGGVKRTTEFTLEDAIQRCVEVAKKINDISGMSAEVVTPIDAEAVNPIVKAMVKMIINGKVIMLEGPTGVGKTEMARQAAELAGILPHEFGYFSLPTLAPEDFAGIPHPDKESAGHFNYLVLKGLNKYKVMMFDETNRAHPKILNALMQLMLERRINDMHFRNLKSIICSINPSEEGKYIGTEEMDDAVRERIDHFIKVKAQPNALIIAKNLRRPDENGLEHPEFNKAFECSTIAVEWWDTLTKEHKSILNPRRLQKIVGAFLDEEGLETAMDPRGSAGTVPLSTLEKKLKQMEVLDIQTLITKTAEVERRMAIPGPDSADLIFRYVGLIKQMRARRMDAEFAKVAHLYAYVGRDMIPTHEREKGLHAWINKAVQKYAGEEGIKLFTKMLDERNQGKKAETENIRKALAKLVNAPQDTSKKTL